MTYQFLTPIQATVRRNDGTSVLMGYGIGDIIEVKDFSGREDPLYHPMSTMLNQCIQHKQEIPLVDGSNLTFHGEPKLTAAYAMACGCGMPHAHNERCGPW
jgi:hypothetical protein